MLQCENPFWTFSLAIYAQPGVAAECLALQSALNIDVNVLLFCAWLATEHKLLLGERNFAAIETCVHRWHVSVVRPLRAVRQAMKPLPEMAEGTAQDLRKDVASLELRSEQIEQAMLFANLAEISAGAGCADNAETAVRANISAFVQRTATVAAEIPPTPLLIAAAAGYSSLTNVKNP